jgi:hypothetical protein
VVHGRVSRESVSICLHNELNGIGVLHSIMTPFMADLHAATRPGSVVRSAQSQVIPRFMMRRPPCARAKRIEHSSEKGERYVNHMFYARWGPRFCGLTSLPV